MKRVLMVMIAALVVSVITSAAREVKTISGEVIELNCYLQKKEQGIGAAHKDCALTCARQGQTLAILAADGFYIIKGDLTKNKNEKLIEWVAAKVAATGDVTEMNDKKFISLTAVKAH